jgi:hypothetical protein
MLRLNVQSWGPPPHRYNQVLDADMLLVLALERRTGVRRNHGTLSCLVGRLIVSVMLPLWLVASALALMRDLMVGIECDPPPPASPVLAGQDDAHPSPQVIRIATISEIK